MTQNGIPVTRLLKIKYNCTSEFIVESKSLKLYLNSFNMTRLGITIDECLSKCKNFIEQDLSKKLNTEVQVNFLDNNSPKINIFNNFDNLIEFIDQKATIIEKFKEAPELIEADETTTPQNII